MLRNLRYTGQRSDDVIQNSDARARHQNPRDRDDHTRNDDAAERDQADQPRQRRVGALDCPGEKGSPDKCQNGRRQGEVERVDTRLPKLADAVGTAVIGQGKAEIQKPGLAGANGFEAGPNDQRQRHRDLVEQDNAEADQHDAAAAWQRQPDAGYPARRIHGHSRTRGAYFMRPIYWPQASCRRLVISSLTTL